jgi:membrane protein required for colicin V production
MNTVDIIVIAVIAISAIVAFLRGFVREVLTVGSWLGAALVTLYGYGIVKPHFEQWISSKLAADIAGGLALFIGSLIVFSIISHILARFVRGSALTAVDRSLGLLFGLVRGAILTSLAYMILVGMDSNILQGARTAPMMAKGAEILRNMAPKELADELPSNLQLPPPTSISDEAQKRDATPRPAYKRRQNDDLQRLIETTTGK